MVFSPLCTMPGFDREVETVGDWHQAFTDRTEQRSETWHKRNALSVRTSEREDYTFDTKQVFQYREETRVPRHNSRTLDGRGRYSRPRQRLTC